MWTHSSNFPPFFGFGGVASEELRAIAEDGDGEGFIFTQEGIHGRRFGRGA